MPGGSEDKRIWLKTTLGVDVGGGSAAAGSPTGGAAPGAAPQAKPAEGGGAPDPDIEPALKALNDEAEALDKTGFDVNRMFMDHDLLAEQAAKAKELKDDAARQKALAGVKQRALEAVEHAQALSKSLKSIMKDGKGEPSEEQKSAIYKKAIEDLYGLKINVPDDFKNTHFDRVFTMCGMVPKDDVKQKDLKTLTYSKAVKGGEYGGVAEITMGDFEDAKTMEPYELNGEKIAANSFNVTTLHEIGHAVDEKNEIMKKNQGNKGCGGWASHKLGEVVDIVLGELKKQVKPSQPVPDPLLKQAVFQALYSGEAKQLAGISNKEDWQKIEKFLVDKCLPARKDAEPWSREPSAVFGGRAYVESEKAEWWSYDHGARATMKVTNYQWRSPSEWFAELYAVSWLVRKPPPAGVDAAVLAHMCQE